MCRYLPAGSYAYSVRAVKANSSRREAQKLLDAHMASLERLDYETLRTRFWGEGEATEVLGSDGTVYQVETQSLLDDKRTGRLLIAGGIDGGAVSATRPLIASFLVEP
jgi:hypothetical protein